MSSSEPGNGWTENKALASCRFSMRVLFYWFDLHLVCGATGDGKSRSLFWVMRPEVSNKHFWLPVCVKCHSRSSSAAAIPVSTWGFCTPLSGQPAEGQQERKTAVFTDGNALPELCLHSLGRIGGAFSSVFLWVCLPSFPP